jgi:hypothetical protein
MVTVGADTAIAAGMDIAADTRLADMLVEHAAA